MTKQDKSDMRRDYEGYTIPCPVCAEDDDMLWQPRVFIGDEACHECGTEFTVEIRWQES